jgi:hypothetical protein
MANYDIFPQNMSTFDHYRKNHLPLYNFQAIFSVAHFRILKEKNAYAFFLDGNI